LGCKYRIIPEKLQTNIKVVQVPTFFEYHSLSEEVSRKSRRSAYLILHLQC